MLTFANGFKPTTRATQMMLEGSSFNFYKLVLGSGVYTEVEDGTNLFELKDKKQEFSINNVSRENSTVTISTVVTNANLQNGYVIREVGVTALDSNGDEVLFLIGVPTETDSMPAHADSIPDLTLDFTVKYVTSNSAQVSLTVPVTAFARASDLAKTNEKIGLLEDLNTKAKTVVAAINEVFQLGSEKKTILASNLAAMGINCSDSETWESLLGKILDIFTGTDCSSATAVESKILEGFTAGVGNSIVTGTMPDNTRIEHGDDYVDSTWNTQPLFDAKTNEVRYVTEWGANGDKDGLVIIPHEGYWPGIGVAYEYVSNDLLKTKLGITADRIVKGNTICGVEGNGKRYATGTTYQKGTVSGLFGSGFTGYCKKINKADYTTTNDVYCVDLNLDWIPNVVKVKIILDTTLPGHTYCMTYFSGCHSGFAGTDSFYNNYGYSFRLVQDSSDIEMNLFDTSLNRVYFLDFFSQIADIKSLTWEAYE